jgi:dihydrofolate reductase
MLRINLIAAMAKHRTIGKDNQMPWYLPADLKHFKSITLKHPVIMGRKTYQSIGKPLPGRRNIVVSRDTKLRLEGVEVVNDLEQAITLCNESSEVMVIGGANIYQQMLSRAARLYLTFIDLDVEGDTHFPDWQGLGFQQISSEKHQPDERNQYAYEFVTLDKKT